MKHYKHKHNHKILGILVVLALVVSAVPFFATPVLAQPDGSESDPWEVDCADALQSIGQAHPDSAYWATGDPAYDLWEMGDYYILTADIDLATFGDFKPIGHGAGTAYVAFTGSLDGQGYTISNMTIDEESDTFVGMFARGDGPAITNLNLVNIDVTGYTHTGLLIGYAGTPAIVNVHIQGSGTSSHTIGGFTAALIYGTIEYSSIDAILISTGSVNRCGGVAGSNYGTISQTYSTGSITVNNAYSVGGIVGELYSTGVVTNSFSHMDVTAAGNCGGIVGLGASGSQILNSYTTGTVTAHVSGAGGVIGSSSGTVTNCFWDYESSGNPTSAAGTRIDTTAEMWDIDTYLPEWDIVEVGVWVNETWWIQDGFDYPRLGWEDLPGPEPVAVTLVPTHVYYTTTELRGEIDDDDGADCEARFRHRELGAPAWIETAWQDNDGAFFNTGHTFTENIGGLTHDTTYEFQAQARDEATQSEGPWSASREFTTPEMPTVVTNDATDITGTGGRLHGEVTDFGQYSEFQWVRFWWDTDEFFGDPDIWTEELTPYPTEPFSWHHDVTGLDPDTRYYFVAWASPDGVEWYIGDVLFFDTLEITLPVGAMYDITDITQTSARLWGIVIDDGNDPSTRQFRYKRVIDPDWVTGGMSTATYVTDQTFHTPTGDIFLAGTQYEVQVRLQNDAGVGDWSTSMTFWTASYTIFSDPEPSGGITVPYFHPVEGPGSVQLSIGVTHSDELNIDVTFYDDSDDSVIGTHLDVTSGETATVIWDGLSAGQPCAWYVIVDDNINPPEQSFVYTFLVNIPPDATLTQPDDEAVETSPVTLGVNIIDVDWHDVEVTFWNADTIEIIHQTTSFSIDHPEEVTYNWHVPPGTYRWYVTADDGYDVTTTETRTFHNIEVPPVLSTVSHEFDPGHPGQAILYGQAVLNDADAFVCNLYFQYRIDGAPTWEETDWQTITEDGIYSAMTAVLEWDTSYEWRVALDYEAGVEYSDIVVLEMPTGPITITILEPTDITDMEAIIRAHIDLEGHGGAWYWFVFGEASVPVNQWSYAPYGFTDSTGNVAQQLLNLKSETEYGYYVIGIDIDLTMWAFSSIQYFETERSTAGLFHKLVAKFGIDDDGGRILFAVLCIILIPAILYAIRRGLFIPLITATALVAFFAVIGFIPWWIILILVSGLVLGFWMVIRGAAATAGGDTE